MKKIAFVFSAVLLLNSCDKIPHPIITKTTVVGSKFITRSNANVSNIKKTLLEDYTGMRCINCPSGTSIIKTSLIPAYGNNLVVISVHQGDQAQPFGAAWPNDYRTAAGEIWGGSSGFGKFIQWPTGLVNRKKYDPYGIVLEKGSWTSVVQAAAKDPFVLKLDVETEYDTIARALNVNVTGTFKLPYTNKINITAVYLQDSVIGKQADGSLEIDDYEFEDMLRGDINGAWGVEFTHGSAFANSSATWSTTGFLIPKTSITVSGKAGQEINDKKVSVVVFAYDATTKEVIQAEKVKIRP